MPGDCQVPRNQAPEGLRIHPHTWEMMQTDLSSNRSECQNFKCYHLHRRHLDSILRVKELATSVWNLCAFQRERERKPKHSYPNPQGTLWDTLAATFQNLRPTNPQEISPNRWHWGGGGELLLDLKEESSLTSDFCAILLPSKWKGEERAVSCFF